LKEHSNSCCYYYYYYYHYYYYCHCYYYDCSWRILHVNRDGFALAIERIRYVLLMDFVLTCCLPRAA